MRVKDEKGFSLVEVLVVIMILAIVGAAILGFMVTSTKLFSGSKNEVDVQTEAQLTINWLNDVLVEAGHGVSYREEDASGRNILEIYNTANVYTITWMKAENRLYCDESRLEDDGTLSVVTQNNLLAEYVTEFKLDTGSMTAENPLVVLTLGMEKAGRSVELVRNVSLRNGVLINRPIEEIYAGSGALVSSVLGVVVYPVESYQAKGATAQFSARVTGIGFPSQQVTWSIPDRTGLHPGTVIDEQTGVLTISPEETAASFRVAATSVELNKDGNRVSSTETSGIVKIMTITGVEIVNIPADKQEVGTIIPLTAVVHGQNMDGTANRVSWSIPEESRKEGLSVSASGSVMLGLGLYNAFPNEADRANASVTVRATSVSDPTKYADCVIRLSFPDINLDFDNLSFMVSRNSYVDLNTKLQTSGITSSDMKLVWSMVNDAGLGSKVSLDAATGIVTVAKDIDYGKEYTLEVKVSALASGTQEAAAVTTVKVVIPKVTISFGNPTCQVVKGSSAQMQFIVNGLAADAADLQVTSTPAVRNTLLYLQGNNLVVSVGKDVKREDFKVTVSLRGHGDISTTGTVLVQRENLSDDELAFITNVQDTYLHVPVPDKENRAPTLEQVKNGYTMSINGVEVRYSYDNVRGRAKIQLGSSGSSYYYAEIAGSDIVWHRGNLESAGSVFYVPVPGEGAFPASFEANGRAEITYRGDKITYQRYLYNNYGAEVPIYQVYDDKANAWFQYNEAKGVWQNRDDVINRAREGTAWASSGEGGFTAGQAIDGNEETRWGSEFSDPQWLVVDLGSVYNINKFEILWEGAHAKRCRIEVSNNGTDWTSIHEYTCDIGLEKHRHEFVLSARARYVRIYGMERNSGYGYSIHELYIYGSGYQP